MIIIIIKIYCNSGGSFATGALRMSVGYAMKNPGTC